MSAAASARVGDFYDVCRRHRLCPSHAEVFQALGQLARGRRLVETSYARLADAAEVSVYTARRAIERLAARRLVEIDRSRSGPDRLVVVLAGDLAGLAIGAEPHELPAGESDSTDAVPAVVRFPTQCTSARHQPETEETRSPALAHAQALALPQAAAPSVPVTTEPPDAATTCERSRAAASNSAHGSLPILNEKERNTSNSQGDLGVDLGLGTASPASQNSRAEPNLAGRPPPGPSRRPAPTKPESRSDPPTMGQALCDSLNGMFTRSAVSAKEQQQQIAERIARSLDDPTCDSSLYRRVAEAVIEGRMERDDLNGILGHIAKKRAAGEIRASTGALFNHLIKRRLGANYKGGAK